MDSIIIKNAIKTAGFVPISVMTTYDELRGKYDICLSVVCPCGGQEEMVIDYTPGCQLLDREVTYHLKSHIERDVAIGTLPKEWLDG